MYAFGAVLEAAPAAVPTFQLIFEPNPLAVVALIAVAAVAGSLLGIAMRHQRSAAHATSGVSGALPRPASC